ncbi:helix-turn-helix domain-containing protein [Bradyrhizobium sp. JR3.5]
MSSIMRRRRGLKSAISILLSEGVGSNTHILSARRRSMPPCPLRRGSGFVQSRFRQKTTCSSQSTIARLESGQTLPSTKTLLRFAKATGSKFQIRLSAA